RIQAQLPADAAWLAWVDVPGQRHAADPNGEHWACLVKHRGPPVWVRLPGSGAEHAWTAADDALPRQVAAALSRPPGELAPPTLLARLTAQRLEPLGPHLEGVRRLVVVPAGRMAGVPVEALTERYTVSYAPSGTVFARLAEMRKLGDKEASRQGPLLLAL